MNVLNNSAAAENVFTRYVSKRWTIDNAIKNNARKYPNEIAYIFEGEELTWNGFDDLINAYAYRLLSEGFNPGDRVALMLENRLEFLLILFALNRIGVAPGLINTGLSGQGLIHCINEINSTRLIFGSEVSDQVDEILPRLNFSWRNNLFLVPDSGCHAEMSHSRAKTLARPAAAETGLEVDSLVSNSAICCYIFTSGTTGLPKASKITHDRWYKASFGFKQFAVKTRRSDRYYLCLPLFHGNALFVGIGSAILAGASVFLRRKFSASNFLREARTFNTNTFIYIGELCRYLLHTEKNHDDWDNPITKCAGNGLKADIWDEFKQRFAIKRVGEFYASTEGNVAFMNYFNQSHTIGVSPASFKLAKYDVLNDQLVLDSKGMCIEVKPGEPGLLLAKINRFIAFDGYTRAEDTERKLVRNAFKQGDRYFNTGDLIKRTSVGFSFGIPHYQFVDRIGDTFRWKGENVSTSEVEAVLNTLSAVKQSNVYGVEIPHTNGKAGMAALVLEEKLDLQQLSSLVENNLPHYARPVFIRVLQEMETTGTFKLLKGDLRKAGFNPDDGCDALYFLAPGEPGYRRLDFTTYQQIMNGFIAY